MNEKDLFELYKKDVYKTCYFMLHHSADAEDVCQEVFMAVFRYDWRGVEFLKTWLMRVAVNQCLNHLKKSNRTKTKENRLRLNTVQRSEKAAETVVEEQELAMECIRLLQALPGKIRAVASLRYLNEYHLNEIADILAIPVGTVKSRLNKGLKLMKKIMEADENKREKECEPIGQNRTNVHSVFKR